MKEISSLSAGNRNLCKRATGKHIPPFLVKVYSTYSLGAKMLKLQTIITGYKVDHLNQNRNQTSSSSKQWRSQGSGWGGHPLTGKNLIFFLNEGQI